VQYGIPFRKFDWIAALLLPVPLVLDMVRKKGWGGGLNGRGGQRFFSPKQRRRNAAKLASRVAMSNLRGDTNNANRGSEGTNGSLISS
jgi:hypothetical protein